MGRCYDPDIALVERDFRSSSEAFQCIWGRARAKSFRDLRRTEMQDLVAVGDAGLVMRSGPTTFVSGSGGVVARHD